MLWNKVKHRTSLNLKLSVFNNVSKSISEGVECSCKPQARPSVHILVPKTLDPPARRIYLHEDISRESHRRFGKNLLQLLLLHRQNYHAAWSDYPIDFLGIALDTFHGQQWELWRIWVCLSSECVHRLHPSPSLCRRFQAKLSHARREDKLEPRSLH